MKHFNPSDCQFLRSVLKPKDWPEAVGIEYVFWGRSNVGKSSLLNAVMQRKVLAHVSKTPGRTQSMNFYAISNQVRYVDLPGYGFAKVSRKMQESWHEYVSTYLATRSNIKAVFVLIDSRRDIQESDWEVIDFLTASGVFFECVYTKIDRLTKTQRAALHLLQPDAPFTAYAVSVSTNEGIAALRTHIFYHARGGTA